MIDLLDYTLLNLYIKAWHSQLLSTELRSEVIICFVDIGGIVDYHCLNVLIPINRITLTLQK